MHIQKYEKIDIDIFIILFLSVCVQNGSLNHKMSPSHYLYNVK